MNLRRGGEFSEYVDKTSSDIIKRYYAEKGFLLCKVEAEVQKDSMVKNAIRVNFDVDRGERIRIKTIRLEQSGRPKEAMSFENINYSEILEEDDWYESRLYELFTSRFLFIVFRNHGTASKSDYRLEKSFFWTMPYADLLDAEKYWQNIKDNVAANQIDPKYFYKLADKKKFHVRPKGRNAADTVESPFGGQVKKYCYWFNNDYVSEIVAKG